jgi:hypothetical protein
VFLTVRVIPLILEKTTDFSKMTPLHKVKFFNFGVPELLCYTLARIIFMLEISGINSYYVSFFFLWVRASSLHSIKQPT